MPKITINKNDFLAGFSISDFAGSGYRTGKFVNPIRLGNADDGRIGLLMSGNQGELIANSAVVDSLITGMAIREGADDEAYAIGKGNSAKIYKFDPGLFDEMDDTFNKNTLLVNTDYGDMVHYWANQASTSKEFAFFTTDNYLGRMHLSASAYNMTANFRVITGSTTHPMCIGPDNIIYGGNGKYLFSYDGLTGADGSFNSEALDLINKAWEIRDIVKWKDYVVIAANKALQSTDTGEAAVFIWDMLSSVPISKIKVNDNYIYSLYNLNDDLYLISSGDALNAIKIRKFDGTRFRMVKTTKNFFAGEVRPRATGYYHDMLMFVNRYGEVMVYGSPEPGLPTGLYNLGGPQHYAGAHTGTEQVGAIMPYGYNTVISYYNGTTNYLQKYPSGYRHDFDFETIFYEPTIDPDKRCQLESVKIYFEKLTSGTAQATVQLYIDGDTSSAYATLGTITYSGDGAIKSKHFDNLAEFQSISIRVYGSGSSATDSLKITRMEIKYNIIENT